jgi:hypothetical protein
MAHSRLKFHFDARVEYVTEELSHNGTVYFMFNIKVVADPEGVPDMDTIQWSVIKSEDDFLQTHKALRTKYGLLKSFQFRNPSAIGNNMFHLTNPVKPRREKKDEFLQAILNIDPLPDEVSAFLCLDNAMYFTKTHEEGGCSSPTDSSHHQQHDATTIASRASITRSRYPQATPYNSSTAAVGTTVAAATKSNKKWYLDLGLVLSFLALAVGAALISQLASTVGTATGLNHKDSYGKFVMQIYTHNFSASH